jgi:hypothetical protein
MKELDVPRTAQVALLHHALMEDALTLCNDRIEGNETLLSAAYDLLGKMFNTVERQRQARSYLQRMRLFHFQEAVSGHPS